MPLFFTSKFHQLCVIKYTVMRVHDRMKHRVSKNLRLFFSRFYQLNVENDAGNKESNAC